jgi:hypothetical protein
MMLDRSPVARLNASHRYTILKGYALTVLVFS